VLKLAFLIIIKKLKNMSQTCPFCFSGEHTSSYLPSTFFNNKRFDYVKCINCKLIYLNPFPVADDFEKLYPATYQSGINSSICEDPYKKIGGIRFSYGKQFDLITKYASGKKKFLITVAVRRTF